MQNKIIWLTGGSGSGKSTAADIFRRLGLAVIDADKVARKVMKKGEKAYNEAVEAFGSAILMPDGSIDRKKLGNLVFADREKLIILNSITHKYIKEEIKKQIKDGVTVIDAALPPDGFISPSYTVAVTADRETRIKRIVMRDFISEEQAKNRISSQISDEEYKKIADVVFYNNGTAEELKNQIEKWCKDEKII